jgi:DegV family protein with EDD domain
MPRVALVLDTTQYLPREVIDRHGFSLVSLYVNWDGRVERESEMGDYGPFYSFLQSGGELPSTSQPSVGDFLAVYEPLIEEGADILSIHLSGDISGTVTTGEQARQALVERGVAPERIRVMDSRTGCAGHGLMAIAAANAVKAGAGLDAAAATAQALRDEMRILFAVETLEYLRRGGRIGSAQAWIGSALKIKPILSIEGEVLPIERVRTSGRAMDRLVQEMREKREVGADVFVIQHVRALDAAEKLVERGREIFGKGAEVVSEIGPVIGTHTGPGLVGVCCLRSALLGAV